MIILSDLFATRFDTAIIRNDSIQANIFDSTKWLIMLSAIMLSVVHCII